ncbi:MAG TPA: TIGR04255 family protein [Steroidobacteraceae bacterium]|nr:TIGR04255 family protein [Steroidobacteraceae bacterium]
MLPKKLKDDSITEALFEVRFTPSDLDEVVVGRLSDFSGWEAYTKQRMPAADIPLPIRKMDATLRIQPLLELSAADKTRRVRIGAAAMSYHVLGRYIGWTELSKELLTVTDHFFKVMKNVTAERLGLRYINTLTKARHNVAAVGDLKLQVRIDERGVGAPLNVNFTERASGEHMVTTRVATPEFVQGPIEKDVTLFVDVDVFTADGFVSPDVATTMKWVARAHEIEKESFFRLFPKKTVEDWREE